MHRHCGYAPHPPLFLWAYDEAPGLVRSVGPGDTDGAAYVGEVLGNFDKVLHIHHEGEDLLMYPQLAERAPAGALHVGLILDRSSADAPGWSPPRRQDFETRLT